MRFERPRARPLSRTRAPGATLVTGGSAERHRRRDTSTRVLFSTYCKRLEPTTPPRYLGSHRHRYKAWCRESDKTCWGQCVCHSVILLHRLVAREFLPSASPETTMKLPERLQSQRRAPCRALLLPLAGCAAFAARHLFMSAPSGRSRHPGAGVGRHSVSHLPAGMPPHERCRR